MPIGCYCVVILLIIFAVYFNPSNDAKVRYFSDVTKGF